VRLDGAFFYAVEASAALEREGRRGERSHAAHPARAEHLISYHILTRDIATGD